MFRVYSYSTTSVLLLHRVYTLTLTLFYTIYCSGDIVYILTRVYSPIFQLSWAPDPTAHIVCWLSWDLLTRPPSSWLSWDLLT